MADAALSEARARADALRSSQGGSNKDLNATDHKCNTKTASEHGVDLTGHGSGGSSK